MKRFFDSKIKFMKINVETKVAKVKFSNGLTVHKMSIISFEDNNIRLRHQNKLYDQGDDYYVDNIDYSNWNVYTVKARNQ